MMRTYQPGTTISSWAFSHNLDDGLLEFTPTLKQLRISGQRRGTVDNHIHNFYQTQKKQQNKSIIICQFPNSYIKHTHTHTRTRTRTHTHTHTHTHAHTRTHTHTNVFREAN